MEKLGEKHKLEKSDYREWERKLSRKTIKSKFKIVKAMDNLYDWSKFKFEHSNWVIIT